MKRILLPGRSKSLNKSAIWFSIETALYMESGCVVNVLTLLMHAEKLGNLLLRAGKLSTLLLRAGRPSNLLLHAGKQSTIPMRVGKLRTILMHLENYILF